MQAQAQKSPSHQTGDSPDKVTWEEARRMLHYVATEWEPREETEADVRAILHRRARLLAKPARDQAALAEVQRALTFTLGAERYAVPTAFVRSIYALGELGKLTPVPCTPAFYVGVVNVRGTVVSVLDLRLLFDIAVDAEEEHPPQNLMVVAARGLELSLVAHEVAGVVDFFPSDLSLPSKALVGINPDYIAGTTADGTILLDLEALFSDERLIVEEEVM